MTPPSDRRTAAELRDQLESTRAIFHSTLAALSEEDRRRRSANPGWTNGELLFHAALGIFMLPPLMGIVGFWGRLPRGWSRRFSAALDASTPFFNWVNGVGPRAGSRILRWESLGRRYDRASARVVRRLERLDERSLDRGMYFPRRWYPEFDEYLTVREVPAALCDHLRGHVADLRVEPRHQPDEAAAEGREA